MPPQRLIVSLVAVLTLLFIGVAAMDAAVSESVGDTGDWDQQVNESFTADEGSVVVLEKSELGSTTVYDSVGNVTVYNNTGSGKEVMEADGNWTWIQGNGTLRFDDDANEFDGTTDANVTYSWRNGTAAQETAFTIGFLPMQLGDVLPVAMGAAFVLALLWALKEVTW